MKNVNGAVAQKLSILKGIAMVILVFIATLTVSCTNNSQNAIADIGGARGQEIRKEATMTDDIGGGKNIKGDFIVVTDIGGGRNSSGGLQFSKATTENDIGGKSTNVGKMFFASTDIGGRNGVLTGNISRFATSNADIGGGRDSVIIKLHPETIVFDIGGGSKSTTTVLLV